MSERITIIDTNETWQDGKLVASEQVERDVTAAVVTLDHHVKLRAALAAKTPATTAARLVALETQVATLTRLLLDG